MARRVPPLNPLRTFESAARNGSFTRAAEELHVSQSAVSRQISLLENYLRIQLFQRLGRTIKLTDAGSRYYADIREAFELIGLATDRLRRQTTGSKPLTIRVYATFAAKWLMRRLPRLNALYPDISIQINTVVTPVDFGRDAVDAAIQLGNGQWPGCESVFLFEDEISPVCSPAYLENVYPDGSPALSDLRRMRLLHAHYRRNDWSDWLRSVGVAEMQDGEIMGFPSSLLAYQAAIDGLGIAMGQLPLLQDDFKAGALVTPFNHTLRRDLAYYLVMPTGSANARDASIRHFHDWLLAEVESRGSSLS